MCVCVSERGSDTSAALPNLHCIVGGNATDQLVVPRRFALAVQLCCHFIDVVRRNPTIAVFLLLLLHLLLLHLLLLLLL